MQYCINSIYLYYDFKEIDTRAKDFREMLNSFEPKRFSTKKSKFEITREIKQLSDDELRKSYNNKLARRR